MLWTRMIMCFLAFHLWQNSSRVNRSYLTMWWKLIFSAHSKFTLQSLQKNLKRNIHIYVSGLNRFLKNVLLSSKNRKGCQMVVVWQGCKQVLVPFSKTYSCHCMFLIVLTFLHTPELLKWWVSLNYQVLPKMLISLFFYIIYFSTMWCPVFTCKCTCVSFTFKIAI